MAQKSPKQSSSALHPAVAALAEAEGRLRDAAAKAAADGQYDALAVITRWAKTLQSLVSETSVATSPPSTPVLTTTKNSRKGGARPTPVAGTPVYSRDDNMLVKAARSKRSRNEYEHRASADVVMTVAECLSEWHPSRKLLTGEQLLEAYEKRKGCVVSYQVYVALGWFTQIGLVRRHGRSGYSVPQPNTIVGDVQKAWDSLKTGQSQ